MRWSTLNELASSLSKPFVEEDFDFFGRTLGGTKELQPRWRRCSNYADNDLGEAVGQAYVAKYFPPKNKERMLQMVKAIKAALDQDIDAATWMSDTTKKAAHAKLAAQVDKIGYPDHWRDYSSVEIKRDDFLGNVQHSSSFEIKRRIAKFGQPADRYEWGMTPPTVNAYEDAQGNTINFPAGILQPPFFDALASDAINYGAIGAVIGHEITHGYDDQGRKFDADGNLKDWWTAADAANYEQRDKCIADEYTEDVPEAGVQQNGRSPRARDTADNGGVHLALSALDADLKSKSQSLDTKGEDGLDRAATPLPSLCPHLVRQLACGNGADRLLINAHPRTITGVDEWCRPCRDSPGPLAAIRGRPWSGERLPRMVSRADRAAASRPVQLFAFAASSFR